MVVTIIIMLRVGIEICLSAHDIIYVYLTQLSPGICIFLSLGEFW